MLWKKKSKKPILVTGLDHETISSEVQSSTSFTTVKLQSSNSMENFSLCRKKKKRRRRKKKEEGGEEEEEKRKKNCN